MSSDPPPVFDVTADGVVLRLHVQPGAARSAVIGRYADALKVKVAAPPVDGKANDAVCALVADLLGVRTNQVVLVSGAASRSKRVAVRGVRPDDVAARVHAALDAADR